MTKPVFEGSGTALVTPLRDGAVDYAALERIIEAQAAGGTAALIVCGTTGEGATLAGGGALEMARRAEAAGADGLLMVTPYYNKTTQAGLIQHFTYVADRSSLPLILYNVPSRTGVGITPETYAILAGHDNIAGVKEASGDIGQFARTMALCGDQVTFYSGNDSDTVAMMALGARGVISVASNLVPEVVARLCALCLAGDYAGAAKLNREYMDLFAGLFTEVNPIPVKTAMAMAGLCSDEMRLPLVAMGKAHKKALAEVLEKHGLLAKA